jgi:hypothetical protein
MQLKVIPAMQTLRKRKRKEMSGVTIPTTIRSTPESSIRQVLPPSNEKHNTTQQQQQKKMSNKRRRAMHREKNKNKPRTKLKLKILRNASQLKQERGEGG